MHSVSSNPVVNITGSTWPVTGVAVPALAYPICTCQAVHSVNETNLLDSRTSDTLDRKPGMGWGVTSEMSALQPGFRWLQPALAGSPPFGPVARKQTAEHTADVSSST
jgi:hypothetical protein